MIIAFLVRHAINAGCTLDVISVTESCKWLLKLGLREASKQYGRQSTGENSIVFTMENTKISAALVLQANDRVKEYCLCSCLLVQSKYVASILFSFYYDSKRAITSGIIWKRSAIPNITKGHKRNGLPPIPACNTHAGVSW